MTECICSPSLPEIESHLSDVQFRVFRRIFRGQPYLRYDQLFREAQNLLSKEKELDLVISHLQSLLLIEKRVGAVKSFDEYFPSTWGKMFAEFKHLKR